MINEDAARLKVALYISETVRLPDGDEFVISFREETENEWIFAFSTRLWIETQDTAYAFPGPKMVQVDKTTGQASYIILDWKL